MLALQEYDGGVVLVSHDRALLRTTCDRFMLVANGTAEVFEGDLEDYREWLSAQQKKDAPEEKSAAKNDRLLSKANRQARLAERRPLLKEAEQLEKDMEGWQREKGTLDERLADPALYESADKTGLQTLLKKQAELNQSIENAEMRWLEIHEQLELLPVID
jgi:ATP-binding cassette subfamily F protein 3